MKNHYFSLRHIIALVLLLAAFTINSCRKESVSTTLGTNSKLDKNATLIADAKAYLDSALKTNSTTVKLSGMGNNSEPATFNGHLFWDKAKSYLNKNFEVVEVPAALDYKQVNFYKLSIDTSASVNNKSVVENAFVRVLIFKDSTKNILDKQIITYIPDKKYLEKNPDPSDNNWINNIDKNYSGYIEYRTWENIPYCVLRLDNGKVSSNYSISGQGVNNLKVQGLKVSLLSCTTVITDNYIMVCIGSTCSTTYTGSTASTVCTATADFNYGPSPSSNVGSTGGGGSNVTTNPTLSDADIAKSVAIMDDNGPINPLKFINCFTDRKTAKEYKMTLYIAQPTPGSNDQISFFTNNGEMRRSSSGQLFNVGHAFVGFQKINTDNTSVTQIMGFYPKYPLTSAKGVIEDDGGHVYSVSYTATVTATQFQSALNNLSYDSSNTYYRLSNGNSGGEYNCIDAAILWMTAAGVNLPGDTPRNSFTNTPGDYGQALRTLNGTNTTSGNAPSSHGECN